MTSPAGIWYLVDPRRGSGDGPSSIALETAAVAGTGPGETVLAASMNNDFRVFPNASFPVYTLSTDSGHEQGDGSSHESRREGVCQGECAVYWPPVLPQAPKPGQALTSVS